MSDWLQRKTLPENQIIWNADPNKLLVLNEDDTEWMDALSAFLQTKGISSDYRPRIEKFIRAPGDTSALQFLTILTNEAFHKQDAGSKRLLGTLAELLQARDLVLLPMARRSQIDWLSTRYTYTKTPSALEQAVLARIPNTVPEKYKASTVRLLFGFAHIPNADFLGNNDISFFFDTDFHSNLSAGYKSAFSHAFQSLDDIACASNPKRQRLIISAKFRNQRPTLSDKSAWWFCDPQYGHKDLGAWQDAYSQWISSLKVKNIRRDAYASRRLSSYLSRRETMRFTPADFTRSDLIRTQSSTEFPFVEWLAQEKVSEVVIAETLGSLRAFFDWWGDVLRPQNLKSWVNPIKERDRKTYGSGEARLGKSNKTVLPKRIIEMAKSVILDDDFAFPRSQNNCYTRSQPGEKVDKMFCPVLPVCLLTLLTLPIRGLQARLLDSGEADENITFPSGFKTKNTSSLATKGRQMGVLQEMIAGPFEQNSFVGFRISTNKTAILKGGHVEIPYDIPWHEQTLQNAIVMLRAWQSEHNPITRLITRKDILERSARIDGNVSKLPSYAFLFRDSNSPDKMQPITWAQISRFWVIVLQEVQNRLAQEGTQISLVEEILDKNGKQDRLTTKYPIHSLRVSGITHFVEAGVPLHIISEFVAGHSQLLMTLYYTKIDDAKVRDVLDDAIKKMDETDDTEVLECIRNLQDDAWDQTIVGGQDARSAAVSNDTGTWHIDIDGICPVGRTRCHEGGEPVKDNGKVKYTTISFNSFNCSLCRFRLTGPAFLQGQVTVFNAALHAIKEKAEQRVHIEHDLSQVRDKGTERKIRTLKDRLDRIDEEISTLVVALGRRLTHIQMSHALLKRGSEHSFLTGLNQEDLHLVLREASEWEALDFAAQTSSFFPELGTTSARFRKGMLLDRVAQANGLDPLFLSLSPNIAAEAANRLTALLDDMIGPQKVRDLMEYRTTLEDLGLAGGFAQLVDKSILLAESAPLLLEDKS